MANTRTKDLIYMDAASTPTSLLDIYSPPYGWHLPQLFTSLKTRHCFSYCSTKKCIGLSLYINPFCRHVHQWSDNQNVQACSVNQITTVANFSTLLTYVELPQHFKQIRYYINKLVNTSADRISRRNICFYSFSYSRHLATLPNSNLSLQALTYLTVTY